MAEFETAQSIIEDIENISESDEQFREFKKYQEYWENLDIIRQQQEKMLKRDKYSKLVDYSDCKADFDKGLLVFRISKNDFNFSNGERIRGCDRDCFNQNYDADSYDLDKIPSIGIGTLINYDKNNGLLFVEPYNTTLTKKFSQNENLSKGKIWIDDIGTKSILNKQKHALKKIFKKETANVKLRDFVPEVGYLLPAYGRSVDYSCFSSEFEIMTENQKQAIKSSLSCDDIYLIQGPPGTGKTTVICEIAQYLVKSNNKVLLSSQTNLGVDNVLERIGNKPNVKAIRIGREEKFERGSEQYALNRRVDDLQRNIINKMQKNREEITCINQEVFQLQNVYTAHDKVAEMLKAIVNILESYNEKLEEKHILQDRLDAELGNMLKIKECMDNFMQNHEKNLGYLEELYNIQQKSRNSLKENIIAYKVFRELELSDEDRIDVENYAMILDEIVSVIEKVKDIQNQELRFEQERQTMLQTLGMIKKQIENIKAQASSVTDGVKPHLQEMIQEKTQRSDDIILQVKEFDLELKGILSKKEDMLNHIQQLKRQALGIKQKIEYYIDTNSDLWLNVFGESRITKESFIKLFKLQDAFKEEYASVDERLELVLYLEDYEEYRFNSLYCQQ
ncbi:hypothetical protein FJY84_08945, partial [Candidatus Bathyarchaeota archaeon]|nr:hypothetical protein [Candidatus Bathyarchaeota archaeon]